MTAPNLNVTTNTYDALDRLIQVDDSTGQVANYTYDARQSSDRQGRQRQWQHIYLRRHLSDYLRDRRARALDLQYL